MNKVRGIEAPRRAHEEVELLKVPELQLLLLIFRASHDELITRYGSIVLCSLYHY